MAGGSSTAQAQSNQQNNQAQAEQYLSNMISGMANNLKNYIGANPSPASTWGAIKQPTSMTGTFGGGQAGGQPTFGRQSVQGGAPYNPPVTPLMHALTGMKPPKGGGK